MSITAFLGPVSSSNESSSLREVLRTSDTLHPGVTAKETAEKVHSTKLVFHPRVGDLSQVMCNSVSGTLCILHRAGRQDFPEHCLHIFQLTQNSRSLCCPCSGLWDGALLLTSTIQQNTSPFHFQFFQKV